MLVPTRAVSSPNRRRTRSRSSCRDMAATVVRDRARKIRPTSAFDESVDNRRPVHNSHSKVALPGTRRSSSHTNLAERENRIPAEHGRPARNQLTGSAGLYPRANIPERGAGESRGEHRRRLPHRGNAAHSCVHWVGHARPVRGSWLPSHGVGGGHSDGDPYPSGRVRTIHPPTPAHGRTAMRTAGFGASLDDEVAASHPATRLSPDPWRSSSTKAVPRTARRSGFGDSRCVRRSGRPPVASGRFAGSGGDVRPRGRHPRRR